MANIETLTDGMNYALAVLSRRAISSFELKKKFLKKGADEEIADSVIERLKGYGYIDDEDYVRRRTALLAGRGYGDIHIRYSLTSAGLPEDIIDIAMEALPPELSEENRILRLMEKKKDKPREKLFGYLARRGFPFEKITNAFNGEDL